DYRQVAKLALPSGIFQINEPILFGLPIIMNPVMFIRKRKLTAVCSH
ncbi:hypothetical protein SK103_004201, partial [Shigella sonnei]|nr:hypothetical protein [Shigella sonnei]